MFMAQASTSDYVSLCRLDVLGLEDSPTGDQSTVHADFLEQLKQNPHRSYTSAIPWEGDNT